MTIQPNAGFPLHRMRRLRGHPRIRDLVRETHLTVNDLIYPVFVYHGTNLRREIASMPGQFQLSLDRLGDTLALVTELGIPASPSTRMRSARPLRVTTASFRRPSVSPGESRPICS